MGECELHLLGVRAREASALGSESCDQVQQRGAHGDGVVTPGNIQGFTLFRRLAICHVFLLLLLFLFIIDLLL